MLESLIHKLKIHLGPELTILAALGLLLCFSYFAYHLTYKGTHQIPLPPGPRPLPLIGNLHQHSGSEQWVQYNEWHEKHGPVMTVKLGMRTVVLLNTHEAVNDLLVRQGRVYCSPPKLHFIGDCMIQGRVPILMPHSKERREVHRLFKNLLRHQACEAYAPLQERESLRFMRSLLKPDGKDQHIWAYSVGNTTTLMYGEQQSDEQQHAEVREIRSIFADVLGGISKENLLPELYPFLNRIPDPFNPWKKAGASINNIFTKFWARRMERGLNHENWNWSRLLNDNKPNYMTKDELLYWIVELEFASIASTTVLIGSFMAAVVTNPEVANEVRAEIDAVIGSDRLPTMNDQDKLPLLRAFINELMRWRGTPPLSMPYQGEEDVEYNGYRIPSNALVVANQWSLNMDPEIYPEPEKFIPQRWIDNPKLKKPYLFGHGRRVCPGEEFARNSLFITFAQILWAFEIVPASPKFGQSRVPGLSMGANEGTDDLTFVPRDSKRSSVLERTCQFLAQDKELLDDAALTVPLQLSTMASAE
ncbi:cytochrome P450 [Aspergillus stella-maris]|uniref:cytochrome P450 n=1 Tax=Aspergillus stella-maris TaxID=1810926 RepID=UPI003CCCA6F9